jgi:hypothetical protein
MYAKQIVFACGPQTVPWVGLEVYILFIELRDNYLSPLWTLSVRGILSEVKNYVDLMRAAKVLAVAADVSTRCFLDSRILNVPTPLLYLCSSQPGKILVALIRPDSIPVEEGFRRRGKDHCSSQVYSLREIERRTVKSALTCCLLKP